MKGKIFTPDEANRMLPLVSRIVTDIVAAYRAVNDALQALEVAKHALAPATGAEEIELERVVRQRDEDVAKLLDRFQGLIEEIEALGGTVKDYEHGAVDFYGEVDGEIVYLSWQPGEARIGFWHRLEDGFGQREALPTTITV